MVMLIQYVQQSLLLLTKLPSTRRQIDTELGNALKDLDNKMVIRDPKLPLHATLPEAGLDLNEVQGQLLALSGLKHSLWEEGIIIYLLKNILT